MFKINRKLEYSLIILKELNQTRSICTARGISDKYSIPFDTASRVMQIMASSGVLKAVQGAHGGYTILQDLNTLSFGKLSDIILGPLSAVDCLSKEEIHCGLVSKCSIVSGMVKLNDKILKLFEEISVMDFLKSPCSSQEHEIKVRFQETTALSSRTM